MKQTLRRPFQTVACPLCRGEVAAREAAQAVCLAELCDRLHRWSARGLLTREALAATLADVAAEHAGLHAATPAHTDAVEAVPSRTAGILPAQQRAKDSTSSPILSRPGCAAVTRPATGDTQTSLPRRAAAEAPAVPGDVQVLLPPEPAGEAPAAPRKAVPAPPERPPQPLPCPDAQAPPRLDDPRPSEIKAQAGLDRPRLTWRRVGLALLSERTLNTLLLVGALLILASASVISTLNPTRLAPLQHLGALVATTAVFVLAGLTLRTRFGLPRAGGALLAISAVFLPLDVWTLGERELLRWSPGDRWLAASALCLLTYLCAHALLRNRTFALLTTAAGPSLTLAGAAELGIPLDWWACLLVMLSIVYAGLARPARARLPLLAKALGGSGRALTLAALAMVTCGASAASFGLALIATTGPALAAVWWLAALYFAVCRRVMTQGRDTALAAFASAVAALLTLELIALLGPWTSVAVAGLACLYGGYGYRRARHAAAATAREAPRQWPYSIAVALSIAALAWPGADPAGRCITATVLTILYARGTRWVQGPVPAIVAVALLPFILANAIAAIGLPDPLLVWTGFALSMMTAAEYAIRRRERSRADATLSSWTAPFAPPLFAVGHGTGVVALGACLSRYPEIWGALGLPVLAGPVIPSLLLLTAGLLGVGMARHRPLFVQLAAWLFVLPCIPLAVLYASRMGWIGTDALTGELWATAMLALVYFALAAARDVRGGLAPRVLYPPAYILAAAATIAAMLSAAGLVTLIWLFGLTLVMCAWSGWLVASGRHRTYERWLSAVAPPEIERHARALFGYLCAWLFPLWLFAVLLRWGWIPDARGGSFGVELTLLAPIYLCGAAYLRRRAPEQAAPWIAAGAVLAALGPLLAIANPSAWLAASAAATISLLTYMGAALTFRRPVWGWGVALTLPLLAQVLFAHVDMGDHAYYLLPHIPVIGALLATGDTLRARRIQRAWPRPFDLVACGLLALGLVYSAFVLGINGINGINDMGHAGLVVVAPTFAFLLAAYASRLRRRAPAWLGVGYGLIALQGGFVLWRVPSEAQPVCWAVLGLALTALLPRVPALWDRPVSWTAAALAVFSSTIATFATGVGGNRATEQACMLTFAIVGLQLVTRGVERRERMLIYGGVAIVGLAYQGRLLISGIAQPQFFVLPAGAYLLAVAYAEWRVAPRRPVKKVLEWSAVLLTVGTSLLQALGVRADGVPSSVYDLLVIGEGLALLWLGNRLYWKDTLTVGAVALCVDAALIVKEPLRAIDTWYIVALAGLAIIGFVIAVEKKRQDLAVLIGQWRRLRDTWD